MTKTPAYLITVCSAFLERLEMKLINQETWDHFKAVQKIAEGEELPPIPDAMVEDDSLHSRTSETQAREELTELFAGVHWSGTYEADFAQNIAPSRFDGETFYATSIDPDELERFVSTHKLVILEKLEFFS